MVIDSISNQPFELEYSDMVYCHHSSNAVWVKTYLAMPHVRNVIFPTSLSTTPASSSHRALHLLRPEL